LNTCYADVLHTIHETPSAHCTKIAEVVEEDNYGMYDDILKCELQHNSLCSKDLDFKYQPYDCLRSLKAIFFNTNFNAISYAYSSDKPNLMRFITDKITVFSLDDPDFIALLVRNEYFTAKIYKVVLESLVEKDFILDQKVPVLT